jgi:hypothetical protein
VLAAEITYFGTLSKFKTISVFLGSRGLAPTSVESFMIGILFGVAPLFVLKTFLSNLFGLFYRSKLKDGVVIFYLFSAITSKLVYERTPLNLLDSTDGFLLNALAIFSIYE